MKISIKLFLLLSMVIFSSCSKQKASEIEYIIDNTPINILSDKNYAVITIYSEDKTHGIWVMGDLAHYFYTIYEDDKVIGHLNKFSSTYFSHKTKPGLHTYKCVSGLFDKERFKKVTINTEVGKNYYIRKINDKNQDIIQTIFEESDIKNFDTIKDKSSYMRLIPVNSPINLTSIRVKNSNIKHYSLKDEMLPVNEADVHNAK